MTRVLYAVRPNPATEVLERLAEAGSSFDVASPGEIERCLKPGIDPARLAFGNTIKKERDIACAYSCGLGTFTVDAEAELDKVIRQAPVPPCTCASARTGAGPTGRCPASSAAVPGTRSSCSARPRTPGSGSACPFTSAPSSGMSRPGTRRWPMPAPGGPGPRGAGPAWPVTVHPAERGTSDADGARLALPAAGSAHRMRTSEAHLPVPELSQGAR